MERTSRTIHALNWHHQSAYHSTLPSHTRSRRPRPSKQAFLGERYRSGQENSGLQFINFSLPISQFNFGKSNPVMYSFACRQLLLLNRLSLWVWWAHVFSADKICWLEIPRKGSDPTEVVLVPSLSSSVSPRCAYLQGLDFFTVHEMASFVTTLSANWIYHRKNLFPFHQGSSPCK